MNKKVTIIAEAGVNHNGDLDTALQLIEAASIAGADFVKFQTFNADNIASKLAVKANYQKNNTGDFEASSSQYEMLKKLEMPFDWYPILIEKCESNNVKFLSTGFDIDSLNFLKEFNFPFFKIPSGEITNLFYLEAIAKFKKDILLSTGMSTIEDVKNALEILESNGITKKQITLLHCNTEYPTPFEDVNLYAMIDMHKKFDVEFGYSDHTLGIEVPIAAVSLGATVIEKHFTLSNSMPGPDHKASLEPNEFKSMVQAIRNIEKAISGSGKKEVSDSERKNIVSARKSLHFSCDMKAGDEIRKENLIALRPGDGISPVEYKKVVGKILKVDLRAGSKLEIAHLK